jgi:hypothetical protein
MILDTQPLSPNFLSPLNFIFSIKKCPSINFFAQKVNVPAMTLNPAAYENPFVVIPHAGDHIIFDQLVVTFKVDEVLQNYLEIYNWIRQLGFPEDWSEYREIKNQPKASGHGIKSDISIMILDSTKIPKFECLLIDAFPISLSQMVFESTAPDVSFITSEATFVYNNFRINAF